MNNDVFVEKLGEKPKQQLKPTPRQRSKQRPKPDVKTVTAEQSDVTITPQQLKQTPRQRPKPDVKEVTAERSDVTHTPQQPQGNVTAKLTRKELVAMLDAAYSVTKFVSVLSVAASFALIASAYLSIDLNAYRYIMSFNCFSVFILASFQTLIYTKLRSSHLYKKTEGST